MISLKITYGTSANRTYFITIDGESNTSQKLILEYGEIYRETWTNLNEIEKAERFQDALAWLRKEIGLSEPESISPKMSTCKITDLKFDSVKLADLFCKNLAKQLESRIENNLLLNLNRKSSNIRKTNYKRRAWGKSPTSLAFSKVH